MSLNKIKIILFISVVGMATLACNLLSPDQDVDVIPPASTAVAQTLAAQLTQIANEATNTPPAPTATPTEVPPTATLTPTNTPMPTPTKTPAPTATPVPCNRASFITDVTVYDGSLFIPGTEFSKDWRLKNVGSCAWTANYELVYYSGDKMGGASVTKLNQRVEPGETIDVSVDLTAPNNKGEYLGYWMLRDRDGNMFGLGANGKTPFWVEIKVVNPDNNSVYGFAENLCDAGWKENNAPLPCQGVVGPEDTAVILTNNIEMENGKTEDELSLWISLGKSSTLTGIYPALEIQAGNRFLTRVGCSAGSKNCDARFEVSYKIAGTDTVTQLESWVETYDGNTTLIDIDLSALAGEKVQFILTTKSLTNASTTQVFWIVPHITSP